MSEKSFTNQQPQEYTFRVGNITSEGATLVDTMYNIIQLPLSILPHGSTSGSIVRLTLMRDVEAENREDEQLTQLMEKMQNGGEGIINQVVDLKEKGEENVNIVINECKEDEKKKSQHKEEKERQSVNDGMKKKPVGALREK